MQNETWQHQINTHYFTTMQATS